MDYISIYKELIQPYINRKSRLWKKKKGLYKSE